MSKIKLKVNNKLFNLELDEDFATFLADDLITHLSKENNSIKDLVSAYINKNYELFQLHKKVQELNHKLS
jgi:hypothetical protein